jgi:hypothetical protein
LKRDQIKKQFCKENGILLVEVPYWELDDEDQFMFDLFFPNMLIGD